ncbi:MAG: NUDIX domain-containing protein [Lachnospiraceae bacterium]|jgi:8-oxo-dGTP pyrophosphatase MutT (NUDIX family)|nr:NUDIX domain-containing protein [Lachnospiraceae bacterium]
MNQRFRLPISVQLLLVKDNKILLQRRYNTGYEDGKYSFVGGHKEENEEVIEAVIREAKEEIGIEIENKDLQVIEILHRKTEYDEYIDFVIKADRWKGTPEIVEKDKCDQLLWVDKDSIPSNTILFVKEILNDYVNNKINIYKPYGWKG